MTTTNPIAIIGAGPVGLAAAAQLATRGLPFIVFEKAESVGGAMLEWGHVRVFSPWTYNIDKAARTLLNDAGWDAPEETDLPTGAEIVRDYLSPLAALPQIAPHIQLSANVTSITRQGLDKMSNTGRENAPFAIRWSDEAGEEHITLARAVIDATGTWSKPNPIGIDGLSIPGERANADRIAYGIPDVEGAASKDYAGSRVLVVGSGHSAIQSILALLALQNREHGMTINWAMRKNSLERVLGGGLNDQLPARGELGLAARKAIDEGKLTVLAPFAAQKITRGNGGLLVEAKLSGHPITVEADRIIVATGFRPDTEITRELRIALDPVVEAPPMLAPLIDPNFHSCGSVPAHGIDELSHPEKDFTIVGAKSYGRAPTFLMATGYEQVRSIADELAGDPVAARKVELSLPETGVCSTGNLLGGEAGSSCCPAPVQQTSSCCGSEAEAEAGTSCCAPAKASPRSLEIS